MTTALVGSGSKRYNQGKVRMSYIPPLTQFELMKYMQENDFAVPAHGLIRLSEHFCLGVAKYPDEVIDGVAFPNWAKGQYFDSMLINCILRHYYAWVAGENVDTDFGSHHLIAVAWGLCCLHHQFSNYSLYKSFDDRMWTGFSSYEKADYDTDIKTLILYNLHIIQLDENPRDCADACIRVLYDVLSEFTVKSDYKLTLDFKINEERLNKIKNTNYGTPTTATTN